MSEGVHQKKVTDNLLRVKRCFKKKTLASTNTDQSDLIAYTDNSVKRALLATMTWIEDDPSPTPYNQWLFSRSQSTSFPWDSAAVSIEQAYIGSIPQQFPQGHFAQLGFVQNKGEQGYTPAGNACCWSWLTDGSNVMLKNQPHFKLLLCTKEKLGSQQDLILILRIVNTGYLDHDLKVSSISS